MKTNTHWVGTWTATPAPAEGAAFSNHTLRMTPRVSLGGSRLRVRISNACGTRPLAIGAACVGLRSSGPALVPGSNRRLTFGGETSATIAAGALVVSDPVELAVAPLSDIAVSVHLPGDLPASFGITGRYARQTNYVSPPGDFTAEELMPVGRLTDDCSFGCGIDVVASRETSAIVAVGDSLTDANISTHDGHHSLAFAARAPARGAAERAADGGDEPGARRQPHPARHPGRQRPAPLRPRRAGAAGRDPYHHHAGHQRSAEPLGQARRRSQRPADDRRAEAIRRARPGARDQGHRRHADAIRERDLPSRRLES